MTDHGIKRQPCKKREYEYVQPLPGQEVTPKPREQKVINALITGEARTLSSAMVQAGFNPTSRTVRDRFSDGGDLREELNKQMVEAGLTLPFALNKLFSKMDAKKQIMMGKVGISVDDNDAQLRATEQVLKLHERSGRIPSNKEQNGGANIIVIIE